MDLNRHLPDVFTIFEALDYRETLKQTRYRVDLRCQTSV